MTYLELTTKLAAIDKEYRGDDYNRCKQQKKVELIQEYNRDRRINKNQTDVIYICPKCNREIQRGETTIFEDNKEIHSGCYNRNYK